jgi:hypothetical protein
VSIFEEAASQHEFADLPLRNSQKRLPDEDNLIPAWHDLCYFLTNEGQPTKMAIGFV